MLSCKQYTRYLHKSEITPLKWYEKVLMHLHYKTCKLCRNYTKENDWLNHYLSHKISDFQNLNEEEIEQYKKELLQKLNL
ncbi:MAG: hypothetical protein KatS3mg027_0759 [Bacteroidia bacterium]|nr:MAG: hypothetical protein KatS3mg027_0759 [Bacteroidia bacterium]